MNALLIGNITADGSALENKNTGFKMDFLPHD